MNVLVINAGSSSLKYQLIVVATQEVLAKGICERVGSVEAFHKHSKAENEVRIKSPIKDHAEAVSIVLDKLIEGDDPVIHSLSEIDAIGHRVVQGGRYFDRSCLVDEEVIAKIDELAELAPLHNKAAIKGIRACQELMPDIPQVVVFDTSFFQTIPPKAYMYALPYEYYEKYGIRKYGAHGTSHRYVADRAALFLDEPVEDLKLITCHLGNGCSVSAIDHGIAIDTSMGLTPLDGLMMGTRCGSVDPAIVPFLMKREDLTTDEVDDIMNTKSGLLGVSGVSNDLRELGQAAAHGDERAMLAYEMFAYSVKKYIGQYIAAMAGADAIVLTGGVGENSEKMRRMIFSGLQPLGIVLGSSRNREGEGEREISSDRSRVKVLVIPTNEEYMIARDTYEIVRYNIIHTGI